MAQSQEIINIELRILDEFSKVLNEANKKFAELSRIQVQAEKNAEKATVKKMTLAKKEVEAGRQKLRALKEEQQLRITEIRLAERQLALNRQLATESEKQARAAMRNQLLQQRYIQQQGRNVFRGGAGGFFGAMGGYNFGGRGVSGFGRNLLGNALLMGAGGRAGSMMGAGMMGGLGAGAMVGLGAGALALGGAAAFQQAYFDMDQAKEIGLERERTRRRLAVTAPGGRAGARQLQEAMDALANKFGVSSAGLEEGFGKFYISSKKAGVSDEVIMKRMETFTATFTALGLTQEEVKRVMKAFEQITDKNRVMSEELRHQLGDAGLAGIVQDLAKGIGLTTEKLDERMRKGRISPDEFFNGITMQWDKLYMKIALQNANSYEAQAEKYNNTLRQHYDKYWEQTVMPFERKWLEFKMDFLNVAKMILDKLPASKYSKAERASEEKTNEQIKAEVRAEYFPGGMAGRMLGLGNKLPPMMRTDDKSLLKHWLDTHKDWSDESVSAEYTRLFNQEVDYIMNKAKVREVGVVAKGNLEAAKELATARLKPKAAEMERRKRIFKERTRAAEAEAAGKGGFTKPTGGDKPEDTKLKSDYHTPRIININILTGPNSSLVNGFTIENKPMNGDTIDGTLKGKIEEVLYDVITDASTSIARATK